MLNPAYPELKQAVDVSALNLQSFGAGVLRAATRHPRCRFIRSATPAGCRCWLQARSDRATCWLMRWAAPALRPKALKSLHHADPACEGARRAGVRGEVRRVIDRFWPGYCSTTPDEFQRVRIVTGAHLRSRGAGAARTGMHALPLLLAADLTGRIGCGAKARRIDREAAGWRVRDGDTRSGPDMWWSPPIRLKQRR